MASPKPPCPEALQPLDQHTKRFARILREMERARTEDKWLMGRSLELRGMVRLTIADVHAGVADVERARQELSEYVDRLHREAGRRFGYESLVCCEPDEAITVMPLRDLTQVDHTTPGGTTRRAPFEDPPWVTERFEKELDRVETEAKLFARRAGTRHVTIDDLQTYARVGLLDAARTFDERHGVPFSAWATQRMRYTMLDGIRKDRGIPRSLLRQQGAIQGVEVSTDTHVDPLEPTSQQADEDVEQAFCSLELSPEEIVAKKELCTLARSFTRRLPSPEREVLEGYYFGERKLKEVGAAQSLSESWASRTLAQGVSMVRRMLEEYRRTTSSPSGSAGTCLHGTIAVRIDDEAGVSTDATPEGGGQ
jgi:RNA polymerase sigma factor (sigma-70 family)